jgi:hypothetical protein
MMADRPILFSAPMVRALLAGTKTQTRRAIPDKMQGSYSNYEDWYRNVTDGDPTSHRWGRDYFLQRLRIQKGDRLWVREAFMPAPIEVAPEAPRSTTWNIAYAAGGQAELTAPPDYNPMLYNYERWSPSIHMPRWASRITLTVTDVRVQRLQDISEADALAEGIDHAPNSAFNLRTGGYSPGFEYRNDGYSNLPGAYLRKWQEVWTDINGPGAWAANPWVAAYTFTVERRNIDAA